MREVIAPKAPSFAALVQQFFTEYMLAQRAVSPRTVACYRDALMLFFNFAQRRLSKAPTALRLADIQPDLILAFLDHLERDRHNSVRSRNLRLTALRAFLKFAGRRDVSSLHIIERALAVPMKRFERLMLSFLTREEMLEVLGQPSDTWTSQRDHLLLAMLYNTGASLGDHRRARSRRGAGWRTLRPPARQGPQAARGAAVEDHGAGDPGVAKVQPVAARGGCLAAEPRRATHDAIECCPAAEHRRSSRGHTAPQPRQEESLAPHHQAHDGDALAAVRSGVQRHLTVAWPRDRDHHASLR
jgi:hypothetical protein